jgi:hypothetical protein
MKKLFLISIVLATPILLFGQGESNQMKVSPIDFLKYLGGVSARNKDTTGLIYGGSNKLNDAGRGKPKIGFMSVVLLHKDGGTKWYKWAQKNYTYKSKYSDTNYGYMEAAKRLLKEDSLLLKGFNKWVFFMDIKYLSVADIQDGDNPTTLNYAFKPNTKVEIILYEQKAGSNIWQEIDKRVCITDKERNCNTDNWEDDFIKKKVKESNAKK